MAIKTTCCPANHVSPTVSGYRFLYERNYNENLRIAPRAKRPPALALRAALDRSRSVGGDPYLTSLNKKENLKPIQTPASRRQMSEMAAEQGLARSVEEEKILRDIREEKERLWIEIQVLKDIHGSLEYESKPALVRVGTETTDHRY